MLLYHEVKVTSFCGARRMSWASNRRTTRVEDEAYCLLGLFEINMPLLYGEREKAFARLQDEILRQLGDNSLLAWEYNDGEYDKANRTKNDHLLATSPAQFAKSGFIHGTSSLEWPSISVMSNGLQGSFPVGLADIGYTTYFVALNCYDERLPTHLLALATHTCALYDGTKRRIGLDCHPRPIVKSRLDLIRQDCRLNSLDVTLLYRCISNQSTPGVMLQSLRLFKSVYQQEYSLTITDIFPAHHWNLQCMTYQASDSDLESHIRSKPWARGGFALLVEPEVPRLGGEQDALRSWRIEVEWDLFMGAQALVIRCYIDEANGEHLHRHFPSHYYDDFPHMADLMNCPGCNATKCELFRFEVPIYRSQDPSLVLQNLGGNAQLRFCQCERVDQDMEFLDIFVEKRANPVWLSVRERSRATLEELGGSVVLTVLLLSHCRQFLFSQRTWISSTVRQGPYTAFIQGEAAGSEPSRRVTVSESKGPRHKGLRAFLKELRKALKSDI